jgi:lantibiotic modifying enzyme
VLRASDRADLKGKNKKKRNQANTYTTILEELGTSSQSQAFYENLKLVCGNDEIVIQVPSLKRAQCYKSELNTLFDELKHVLNIETRKILVQNLANLMDLQLIDYIDVDLIDYRRTNNILLEEIAGNQQAEEMLNTYFQERAGTNNSFSEYMQAKYPNLSLSNTKLRENCQTNILTALRRIGQDFVEDSPLRAAFNLHQDDRLVNIKSTGSDLHRDGGQVLILEFAGNNNEPPKKIIYKPAPVEADAILVGDLNRLSMVDKKYTNVPSLLGRIDPNLTYLIVPKKDGQLITDHYGYLEYIKHEPWHDIDYASIVGQRLKLMLLQETQYLTEENKNPKDYINTQNTLQIVADHAFKEFLKNQASKEDACDFITGDIRSYSESCGKLLALFTLAGIVDMHAGNGIISDGALRIIDCEICFAFRSYLPDASDSLDADAGLMHRNGRAPTTYTYLYDIIGKKEITIQEVEKSRLFLRQSDEFIACGPDIPILKAKYQETLDLLLSQD